MKPKFYKIGGFNSFGEPLGFDYIIALNGSLVLANLSFLWNCPGVSREIADHAIRNINDAKPLIERN